MKLEICTDSMASAIIAEKGGANRIELCSGLVIGGLTPSYSLIEMCKNNLNIDINVLIRPRAGDFLYDEYEIETMIKDIEVCRKLGVNGIVVGVLDKNGKIDTELMRRLIASACKMEITFHRAIDMCDNLEAAIKELILLNVDRILTSGGEKNSMDGVKSIRRLVDISRGEIEVMAGGGIGAHNIKEIIKETGCHSIHMSAKECIQSDMIYRKKSVAMGIPGIMSEYEIYRSNLEEIKKTLSIVRELKEW
nr:copper homeostasis protein CutC [Oceanirhabdus seepicola]